MRTVGEVDITAVCASCQIVESDAVVVNGHPEVHPCVIALNLVSAQILSRNLRANLEHARRGQTVGVGGKSGYHVGIQKQRAVDVEPKVLAADVHFNVGGTGVVHAGVGVHSEALTVVDRFLRGLFHIGQPAVGAVCAKGKLYGAVCGGIEGAGVAGCVGVVLVGDVLLYPCGRLVGVHGDLIVLYGNPVQNGGVFQHFRAHRIHHLFPVSHVERNVRSADLVVQIQCGLKALCGDGCLFVAVAVRHLNDAIALPHLRNGIVGEDGGVHHVAVVLRLDGVGAVAVGDDLGVCRRGTAPVIGGDQTRQRILRVGLLKFHGVFAFGEELGEPCAVALLSGFVQTAVRYGCCTAEGGSREGDGVAVLGNKGDACFLGGAQQGGRCLVAGHAGNVGVVNVGVRQEFPVVQDQSGEIDDQQNGSGGNAGDDADVPDGVRSCAGTAAGGFLAVSAVILVGVIRTG